MRFTFEVLFLGYFLGVVQMPGGHRHFQFWFTSLYHLLVSLVGLPALSTFWINDYFYPILHGGDRPRMNLQHKVLLGIVAWLITVGPRNDLVVDLLYLIRPILPLNKMQTWIESVQSNLLKRILNPILNVINEIKERRGENKMKVKEE